MVAKKLGVERFAGLKVSRFEGLKVCDDVLDQWGDLG